MQSAYLNGKKILNMTTPKTSNSIRDIPMFDGVEKLFVFWKEKQDKAKKNWVDDGDCLKNLKIWFLQVLWGRH